MAIEGGGMTKKVLVAEEIANEAVSALQGRGYEVDVRLGLSPDELVSVIEPYDALIVRSATKVTDELLDAAKNLKIIGRAGVTVDNIDIASAAEHDVIVCNAPSSNIISTAEHTMALMLAAARMIPQANTLVHKGEWGRHRFMGTELYGKTLAIFGVGRVGTAVAERARGFGMRLIGYDPYCSEERAALLDIELFDSIDEVIEQADFITVHLPRTSDTVGMFGPKEFAKMKTGVILINSARGGIYDIDALADFVAAGKIGAAAIDIFEEEPCLSSPLHELDNVILTPHISAVTKEAQIRAGEQIAEYVWEGLEGSIVPTAIQAAVLPPEVIDDMRPYADACRIMGRMSVEVLGRMPKKLTLSLEGKLAEANPDMLAAGLLDGIISYKNVIGSTLEDTIARAQRHGIAITTTTTEDARGFESAVRVKADKAEFAMTLYGLGNAPRIISMMGYDVDISPAQNSIVFEYVDGPGRIGTIGTIFGEAGINITTMQIGTNPEEKCALVWMNIEGDVTEDVVSKLKEAIDLKNIWLLNL